MLQRMEHTSRGSGSQAGAAAQHHIRPGMKLPSTIQDPIVRRGSPGCTIGPDPL